MKKAFCMVFVLLVALVMALVFVGAASAADEVAADATGLDWSMIVSGALAIITSAVALWFKITNSKLAKTVLGLAETAKEITDSIVSSNDTTDETLTKGTQGKAATLVQEAAKLAPKT